MIRSTLLASLLLLNGCGSESPLPAALDARGDACAFCRMTVSASDVVAQIVAPGEEPRFFDDVGCLAAFLKAQADPPDGAIAYVVDHRTRAWLRADRAVYTRVADIETPMGSHLIAHADAESRRADPSTARGSIAPIEEIFGAGVLPGAAR
jgi:copper chaperone NosL